MTMPTKIAAALVITFGLAAASLASVSQASAQWYAPSYGEQNWMDRASNGGAGHHAGDTNGF
jgi:hypothetical protein